MSSKADGAVWEISSSVMELLAVLQSDGPLCGLDCFLLQLTVGNQDKWISLLLSVRVLSQRTIPSVWSFPSAAILEEQKAATWR